MDKGGVRMDHTSYFSISELESANAKLILKEVYEILEERGYNPVNQLVGYIISGDPGYISSYKQARDKILSIDRAELVAYILKEYLK